MPFRKWILELYWTPNILKWSVTDVSKALLHSLHFDKTASTNFATVVTDLPSWLLVCVFSGQNVNRLVPLLVSYSCAEPVSDHWLGSFAHTWFEYLSFRASVLKSSSMDSSLSYKPVVPNPRAADHHRFMGPLAQKECINDMISVSFWKMTKFSFRPICLWHKLHTTYLHPLPS